MKWSMVQIIFLKRQAMRNLAVSITYLEWLGRHCGLLLSLAHPLKPMRPRVNCAAAAPPSLLFCSTEDANDWMIKKCSALTMNWSH